jgi:hypothetical protein
MSRANDVLNNLWRQECRSRVGVITITPIQTKKMESSKDGEPRVPSTIAQEPLVRSGDHPATANGIPIS